MDKGQVKTARKILSAADQPTSIVEEMERRLTELDGLNQETKQLGTTAPALFSSMNAFVANPSTVSVETFKRMIDTDETVGSGVDFLILCLISRFGVYKHPNKQIEKFVARALNEMEGSWHENLDEMLSAEWAGFSITEVVWKFDQNFDGAAAFVPSKLVTYQPLTIVFAVDQAGNILPDGVYQYQRYYGQSNQYQNIVVEDGFRPDLMASRGDFPHPIRVGADLTYNVIQIDRDKVIHLRCGSTGKFGNQYGRSVLRRCHKSWVIKDTALKLWVIAMDRKASPLLIGFAPPNDTAGSVDEFGNVTRGVRADHAMAMALKGIHNESALVFPGKKGENYDLDVVPVQADMSVYKDQIEYDNKAIMRGLLIPPLILGGDGGGSYALGDAHRAIFQQVVDGKLKVYKQGILDQFVKKIIAYNFPAEMWAMDGVGDFVLEEFDPDVMEKLSNIYNTLTTAGYMSPSEQKDMDLIANKFGLEKRKAKDDVSADPMSVDDIQF